MFKRVLTDLSGDECDDVKRENRSHSSFIDGVKKEDEFKCVFR